MNTVFFHLNIKTCCFGASRLEDAKLNYLRAQRDSGGGPAALDRIVLERWPDKFETRMK